MRVHPRSRRAKKTARRITRPAAIDSKTGVLQDHLSRVTKHVNSAEHMALRDELTAIPEACLRREFKICHSFGMSLELPPQHPPLLPVVSLTSLVYAAKT